METTRGETKDELVRDCSKDRYEVPEIKLLGTFGDVTRGSHNNISADANDQGNPSGS